MSVILLLLLCLRASAVPPPALSVVPHAGTVIASAGTAYWQFASRSEADETPLAHTFLIRNNTKTTLAVERVAVSCDCVQAQISETRSLPVPIAPGQTVPVQVTLNLRRLVAGPVSKSAWLYLHGRGDDGLRLEIRGVVREKQAMEKDARE